MKKIAAVLLSAVLILGNGFYSSAEELTKADVSNEVVSQDTTIAHESEEKALSDSDIVTEDGNVHVQYVSVTKDVVAKNEIQSIVVGYDKLDDSVENVSLTVRNADTNTLYEFNETERTEASILFEVQVNVGGAYEVLQINEIINGQRSSVILEEIGINAVFGVDEAVEMNADAVVVEDADTAESEESALTEAFAAEELDTSVITIDGDNYEESAQIMMATLSASAVEAPTEASANIVVVLDPGHGGNDGGAVSTHSGVTYTEKTLNLKIAQYCKAELESYKGVTVYMTRDTDVYVSLSDRVDYAAGVGADVFVSIHNNSTTSSSTNGAYVYYPNSNYDENIGEEGEKLATLIVDELGELGLVNHGAVVRTAEKSTYPDGSKEDYYGVIRRSKLSGFPGVIVEHAFLSNASDASKYLGSDAALKKLGVADATGIAKYFGLSKTTTVSSSERDTNPYVTYRSHVTNVGWQDYVQDTATSGTTGQSRSVDALNIRINSKSSVSGGITYRTHVSNIGWQSWGSDGEMAGTIGKDNRIEAVQIQLTGNLEEEYDVYYRVHSQNCGWLGWAKNGESAGTEGYGLRMEAIQIVLVKKDTGAPGSIENRYYNANASVSYSTHVQNVGWQNWELNGSTAGTTGKSLRVEAIKIKLDESQEGTISYRTHVQNVGWQSWVKNGATAGTEGQSLRVEALQIKLSGAVSESYDIYYRTHVQNVGWTSWVKNGAVSGTTGKSLRVEAVEIKLVKK